MKKRGVALLLALILALLPLCGCDLLTAAARPAATAAVTASATAEPLLELPLLTPDEAPAAEPADSPAPALDEDGSYTDRDDVALYLHLYGRLPKNFMTKAEARAFGWSGGGLDDYAYGRCIGGDRFGNFEGLLPEKNGRSYYECDIGTLHRSVRGAKRIIYSNDGLIYYTDDHYASFTLLYGEES